MKVFSILLFAFLVLCSSQVLGQVDKEPNPDDYVYVEKVPELINLEEFKRATVYPQLLKEMAINGEVIVRVLVGKAGKVEKHIFKRSTHELMSMGVAKHLHLLRFTPAMQSDKPISYWANIPIFFNFNSDKKIETTPPRPIALEAFAASLVYPKKLKKKKIGGIVQVNILVDEEGKVESHEIKSSPHPDLSDEVSRNIHKLRFTPGMVDGKPAKLWVALPLEFNPDSK